MEDTRSRQPEMARELALLVLLATLWGGSYTFIKLGKQASVKAALDDSRGKKVVTVTPVMTRTGGGRQLRIPLEAGYDGEVFEVGALG